jgi:hypothetical protein
MVHAPRVAASWRHRFLAGYTVNTVWSARPHDTGTRGRIIPAEHTG